MRGDDVLKDVSDDLKRIIGDLIGSTYGIDEWSTPIKNLTYALDRLDDERAKLPKDGSPQ